MMSLTNAANNDHDLLDVNKAQQTLSQISLDIIKSGTALDTLEKIHKQLRDLNQRAQQCIDYALVEQTRMEAELKGIEEASQLEPTDNDYLDKRLHEAKQLLSQCSIIKLRTEELTQIVSERLEKQFISQLFSYQQPTWVVLTKAATEIRPYWSNLRETPWQDRVNHHAVNVYTLTLWVMMITLGAVCGFWLRRAITNHQAPLKERRLLAQCLQSSKRFWRRHLVWFSALLFSTIYLSFVSILEQEWLKLAILSYALIAYVIFGYFLRLIFYPIQPAKPLFSIPKTIGRQLIFQLHSIAIVLLACFTFHLFFLFPEKDSALFIAGRSLLLTFLALQGIGLLINLSRIPFFRVLHPRITWFLVSFISLILLLSIIADWSGLHYLAWHVLIAFFITIGATLVAWVLHQFLNALLSIFHLGDSNLQKKTRKIFGVKRQDGFVEIFALRLAFEIILWGGWLLILLNAWGISQADYYELITKIIDGVTIGGLTIYPLRVVLALLSFSLLILLLRAIKVRFVKTHHPSVPDERSRTIGVIFIYIGFAFALITALLVAGVSFTGLAIIAGALSVGIGFGLQNITNDFISGLILLLERPIKIGDRIIVGDVEGFVNKISIRATHIRSLDKADIILPNAELVSGQVTNLMLKDFKWRIKIAIGVAYGSDTALVRQLLLEAASAHPDVIMDDPENKPIVLFSAFSDSSLQFLLYCIIKDVNKKYTVPSDLHFTIDSLCRKHGIEIAYPQHDIHLKDIPEALTKA